MRRMQRAGKCNGDATSSREDSFKGRQLGIIPALR